MSKSQNIAILIPAAGASKRIGSPKQLLKWGNTTLIAHAIETANASNVVDIFVVLGAYYDRIKPEIEPYTAQILKNENWEIGLGSSIAVGVNHIMNSGKNYKSVLIMLVDQPLIVPFYLNAMISKFVDGKHEILATSYGNGKYGVPALFDKKYFKKLITLSDDQGAQDLIKQYMKHVSSVDIVPLISDIDTEEDYDKIYKANHQ